MSRTTSGALPSTSLVGEPAAEFNEIGHGWQLLRYVGSFGPSEADPPPVAAEDAGHGGFALRADKQIIARVTAVPTRARIDALEHDAAWLTDLWVDPAYRDGPAAHLLVRECVKALDTTFISTSDPEALRVYRDYGQREFGCLSGFLRVLRPQRFAAALPRLPRDAAQERWLALLRRGASWPGGHWVASGTMRL